MIYEGTVVRVAGARLFVKVPDLGGGFQFGPVPAVSLWYEYQADTDPGGGAMVEASTYYKKGDKVIVAQVGSVKENIVVLGRV
jgi:hypothetical protein